MDGVVAYILGKSYVKKSLIGIGALAGAPCQVQSINKVGKTTTITLKWEDNVGGVHTQAFDVEDGADGVSVVGATIDANGHLILTLSDTNTIDCGKVLPQYDTMPIPSVSNVGQILQYIGTTNVDYTKGYFYECVESPVGSGTYIWKYTNVQDSYTKIEIGDLTNLPDNTKNVVENIVDIQLEINQLQGSLLDKEDRFRYNVIPSANASIDGVIIEYIGATNANYTNGYFYQCVESPIGSGTYIWIQKNVQPNNGGGGGDGVVDGYYNPLDQLFYEDSSFLNPIAGASDTIYVDLNTNDLYRYNGAIFIKVSSSAESIQVDTMPTADSTQLNKIYQYIGATDTNYTNGYFYKCKFDGTNYYWDGIPTQDAYTKAEIGALSDLPNPSKTVIENISDLQGSLANIDKDKLDNLAPIYLIGSGLTLDTTVGSPNYGKLQATGISIPVDDKLDASSLNPVQNKVITLALDQLQGSVLEKMQKRLSATADNFAAFDNNGEVDDSGISKNVVPATASISNKLLVASDLSPYQEKLNDGNGVTIDSSNNIGLDITYLTASRVGYIPATEKGSNNGVAELDSYGKVPSSQLPSYVDDVIDGYLYDETHFYKEEGRGGYYNTSDNQFYEDSGFTTLITPVVNDYYLDIPTGDIYQWNGTAYVTPATAPTRIIGEGGVIYISVDSNIQYRWTGTVFAALGGALQLGETSTTAYRGDRGKIAYNHSQITDGSNPHNTTADNVNLKVPIPALSGSKLDVESTLYGINTALGTKADKVASATNGHLAGLDSNGNLTDSGVIADDVYVTTDTAETTIDDADYFPFYDTSATTKKKSLWSNIKSVLKTYFDTLYTSKTVPSANGNLASLDTNGDLVDSGKKTSDFLIYDNKFVDAVSDLNTANYGVYRITSTTQNLPTYTGFTFTSGWVETYTDSANIAQRVYVVGYKTNYNAIVKTYIRSAYHNGSLLKWSDWVEIADVSSVSTKADLIDLAPAFNSANAYSIGAYVTYTDGNMYRFTSAHTAGDPWSSGEVTLVTVGSELIRGIQWNTL